MTFTESEAHDLLLLFLGACIPMGLTGIATWVTYIRQAWRDGAPISGEAIERNRKRGDS